MIRRAESCVTVSSTWLAKNTIAVSMIANSSAKNTGATSANSTAAEPRRLRRNRRKAFLKEAGEAAGDGIEQSLISGGNFCPRKNYPKLIVEVFRQIEAERPAPLTAALTILRSVAGRSRSRCRAPTPSRASRR